MSDRIIDLSEMQTLDRGTKPAVFAYWHVVPAAKIFITETDEEEIHFMSERAWKTLHAFAPQVGEYA